MLIDFVLCPRSETCPTCRNRSTKKSALRIFLNVLTSDGISQDPVVLQCKADNLEFQLKLKDKELENNAKACVKHKEKLRGLR